MVEAITKYTILGSEYVKLHDLNELIKDMQRKTREGKEPGYMIEDEHQRLAAYLVLNHLKVVLNAEKNFDSILCTLMKTRFEREAKEAAEKQAQKEEAVKKAHEAIDAARKAVDRAEKVVADEKTRRLIAAIFGDDEEDGGENDG